MVNFGTSGQIPPSAQKIAPPIQRIHRDIDVGIIEIPQGYHYGIDYNTLHMIPNPRYQGTQNFNPQMG